MKRRASKSGDHDPKKTKVEGNKSKLSMVSPKDCLKSLLSPTDLDKFFTEHWEKKYLHIKRGDSSYYGDLFDLQDLYKILEDKEIKYETEINICKYVNEENKCGKEMLNEEGNASLKQVKKKFENDKATIQFHQPQRFVNILWNIMENLERYFGCIFGSNCYITPKGAQGLAPHCDDVEVFILQLAGKKHWKLYNPIDELSRHYSPDLEQSEIGKPFAELTMEKGDLLYFPRGTIHQAETEGDNHSTHLTLSTYQNNTLGDLLSAGIKHCLDEAIESDVEFRRGLPINFLSYLGTGRYVSSYVEHNEVNGVDSVEGKKPSESDENKDERIVDLKRKMKDLLNRLSDHLDLHVAADSLSEDYMASRLPPYTSDYEEDEVKEEKTPDSSNMIKLKYPEHVRLIIYSDEDSDDEDEDEDDSMIEDDEIKAAEEEAPSKKEELKKSGKKGRPKTRSNSGNEISKGKSPKSSKDKKDSGTDEVMEGVESEDDGDLDEDSCGPHVTVLHSCNNDRRNHMVGDVHEGGIRLPLHFAKALQFIMDHHDNFFKAEDLPILSKQEKDKLVVNLWSEGILEVQ